MKMEVITLTPEEQRVLLLFDPTGPTPQDQQVDSYLQEHQLAPKRRYHETREGKDYLVYYFGYCYLDGHREQLAGLATEADLEALKPF
jgi:hypothetical protein